MPPKYRIGETVYMLRDNKVSEEIVCGIVALFDKDISRYDTKKKPKFLEFRYFLDVKTTVESYGWVRETHIFPSKEELIASLLI